MVIVLLIRVLLRIWHPCYVLIERQIIFWHILYEIMTTINFITFFSHSASLDLDKVCGRAAHFSCVPFHSSIRLYDGIVHDPGEKKGFKMMTVLTLWPPPFFHCPGLLLSFVLGSDVTVSRSYSLWNSTFAHLNFFSLWENYTMEKLR